MNRFLLLSFFLAFSVFANAEITLPNIFSDNMVLQRNTDALLFGWAGPNEEFTVYTSWNDLSTSVKAGNDAKWELPVPTPDAGGPHQIKISGSENQIVLDNVLIGEVWLCSGQSNMEWSANSGIDDKEQEISDADYPNIRLLTVQKRASVHPQENVSGSWNVCSSETMPDFSAVAYFFARKVHKELNIPIGLIDASWGASSAEVWTPESVFEQHPELLAAHSLIQPNPWVSIERSVLYNAMIAPLTNFSIGGVLWYQGESNTANAESYQKLFTNMIVSWRKAWGSDFPFYYVQIAPFAYGRPYEGGVLRDQQRRSLTLKNTGMAMTGDIGTINDIHPQNKKDVGLRLANIALKHHYRTLEKEVYGPLFESASIKGNTMEVKFTNSEGLQVKGKGLTDFELSDENGSWFSAKAKIRNGIVLVSSREVEHPKAVRYAWKSTATGNLVNGAGLPASTFTSQ